MELDVKPTVSELKKALESLSSEKASGKDDIPTEVIKRGNSVLLEHLHNLLCQCWKEGYVPQDMRDANIVTLYKNKGDRNNFINYREISLLSVVGKVFARVVLCKLQKLIERTQSLSAGYDDAALVTHNETELQILLNLFAKACDEFWLTISLKKKQVIAQHVEATHITINNYELEVVSRFTYLGSTFTDDLSLEAEINQSINKATTTLVRLSKSVEQQHAN
ncbi:uncharacterized protein LOC127854507 [Dreissena polymorpha]|uniref:uncharacterized protein LOC127854507 n=1 Tax=Dreissena polymorpha TaxID=45954 RepID=UPI0022655E73|nr:uncharacterized protein LOC127854507 [Dreissena polymorpha]